MYATYYFWPSSFISRTGRQNVGWMIINFVQCIPIYGPMSSDMTKPSKWVCAQRRLRSVWSESSQSARRKLGSLATTERTAKALIRLGVHSFYWFCHVVAHICSSPRIYDFQFVCYLFSRLFEEHKTRRRLCGFIPLCRVSSADCKP